MNKDKATSPARRGEDNEKGGKAAGDKNARNAGKTGELDESTKKGLGKTEDKISERLKG